MHEFDLEDRTYIFAERCQKYIKNLPRTNSNIEYGKQLIRSSGSQVANYIEANERLSKKDFYFPLRQNLSAEDSAGAKKVLVIAVNNFI